MDIPDFVSSRLTCVARLGYVQSGGDRDGKKRNDKGQN
jgi:hypothetical protein